MHRDLKSTVLDTCGVMIGTVVDSNGEQVPAVLLLLGIALALSRRVRDEGALTPQDFSADFLALILLFAISIAGLALTVSAM